MRRTLTGLGFGASASQFPGEPPEVELGLDPSRKAEAGLLQGLIMKSMVSAMVTRFQDPAAVRLMIADSKQRILNDATVPEAAGS